VRLWRLDRKREELRAAPGHEVRVLTTEAKRGSPRGRLSVSPVLRIVPTMRAPPALLARGGLDTPPVE
jgi:hypothetical protein